MNDERKRVEVRVEVNTDRLYGNIKEAIRYLEEIRDQYAGINISLDEHWTGYEDMEMTFVYYRDETDEEMSSRLADEARQRKWAEEETKREAQRKKDLKEFQRLRSKLGM